MIKFSMFRIFFLTAVLGFASANVIARDHDGEKPLKGTQETYETPKGSGQSKNFCNASNWSSHLSWAPTALFVGGVTAYTVLYDRQAPVKALGWFKNTLLNDVRDPIKLVVYPTTLLVGCALYSYIKPRYTYASAALMNKIRSFSKGS